MINNNDTYVSYFQAVTAALAGAGLNAAEARFYLTEREEGLYHLLFAGDWMCYEAYVDAVSGELLGLDQTPLEDREYVAGRWPVSLFPCTPAFQSA